MTKKLSETSAQANPSTVAQGVGPKATQEGGELAFLLTVAIKKVIPRENLSSYKNRKPMSKS